MGCTITLLFDLKPVPKARPRVTRTHTYSPKSNVDFKKAIQVIAKKQYRHDPLLGALQVTAIFTFKRPKSVKRRYHTVRPDTDNLLKALLDALNGVLYKDDCQVVECYGVKEYGSEDQISLIINQLEDRELLTSQSVQH